MSDPIALPSVGEATDLAQRLTLFLADSPESIQVRFDRLIADIDAAALRPSYVADVLATLIRDSLIHTSRTLAVEGDRRKFMHDVVKSIDCIFGDLLRISKTAQIYASDLEQVWVACEPMLDLIPEPDGFLDTVASAVSRKSVQYRYFLSDRRYYDSLKALLQARGVTLDGLAFVEIPDPYTPPVALYIHKTRVIGFRGSQRPEMQQASDGSYHLTTRLDPGWATVLDGDSLDRHYAALTEYTTKED